MSFSEKILEIVILFGLISLFADFVYESARSIIGAYLNYLGISIILTTTLIIGDVITHLSKCFGSLLITVRYSIRYYWILTFLGYLINTISIPLLGFVKEYSLITFLIFLERFGKGFRTPARDILLLNVVEKIGKGKGFAIHEILDQIGAILGPLLMTSLLLEYSYSDAFKFLIIPAIITILIIFFTIEKYRGLDVEIQETKSVINLLKLSQVLKNKLLIYYLIAISLSTSGFIHWFVISYYLRELQIPDYTIPLLYTIAMISDLVIAYPLGYLYDKFGRKIVSILPFSITLTITLLLVGKSLFHLILVSIFLGFSVCIFETISKVVIYDLETENKVLAYAFYNILHGISWCLGNFIIVILHHFSIVALLVYIVVVEFLSLIFFFKVVQD